MKCKDCLYYYSDVNDNGKPITKEYCHYQYDDGYAPCEADDYETEDTDED